MWAMGVTLFAFLTGTLPFYSPNVADLFEAIQHERCVPTGVCVFDSGLVTRVWFGEQDSFGSPAAYDVSGSYQHFARLVESRPRCPHVYGGCNGTTRDLVVRVVGLRASSCPIAAPSVGDSQWLAVPVSSQTVCWRRHSRF
jgi:hypothetical protein